MEGPPLLKPNDLEIGLKYPILGIRRCKTRFGTTICVTLCKPSDRSVFQLFLPARYSHVLSDAHIENINGLDDSKRALLSYEGLKPGTRQLVYNFHDV